MRKKFNITEGVDVNDFKNFKNGLDEDVYSIVVMDWYKEDLFWCDKPKRPTAIQTSCILSVDQLRDFEQAGWHILDPNHALENFTYIYDKEMERERKENIWYNEEKFKYPHPIKEVNESIINEGYREYIPIDHKPTMKDIELLNDEDSYIWYDKHGEERHTIPRKVLRKVQPIGKLELDQYLHESIAIAVKTINEREICDKLRDYGYNEKYIDVAKRIIEDAEDYLDYYNDSEVLLDRDFTDAYRNIDQVFLRDTIDLIMDAYNKQMDETLEKPKYKQSNSYLPYPITEKYLNEQNNMVYVLSYLYDGSDEYTDYPVTEHEVYLAKDGGDTDDISDAKIFYSEKEAIRTRDRILQDNEDEWYDVVPVDLNEDTLNEKMSKRAKKLATVAAGVALGGAISKSISKSMRKQSQNLLSHIRKNTKRK